MLCLHGEGRGPIAFNKGWKGGHMVVVFWKNFWNLELLHILHIAYTYIFPCVGKYTVVY